MGTLAVMAAILWWMLCGSALTLAVMVFRGKRLYESQGMYAKYAERLGKECLVKGRDGEWKMYRVVAVSHKGAVNVRKWDDDSAKAFWVPANKVDENVRFKGAI